MVLQGGGYVVANVGQLLDTGEIGRPGDRATPLNHSGNDLKIGVEVWFKWTRANRDDILNMKAELFKLIKLETVGDPLYVFQTLLNTQGKRVRIPTCTYMGDREQSSVGFFLECFAQYQFRTVDPFTI